MSDGTVPPNSSFLRGLGTAEGWLALVGMIWLFFATVTPGTRFAVRWDLIVIWALGIGLGIGAVRFGGPVGRASGRIALLLLGLALVALVVLRGVADWSNVCEYWTRPW